MVEFGYTDQTASAGTLTYTLAYTDLKEDAGEINGQIDNLTGFEKISSAFTVAHSTFDKRWIYKATYSKAKDGYNFPVTDILTLGVSHVFF